MVESVLSIVPLNISFHRFLKENNLRLWNDLVRQILHVRLNDQKDVFIWNLHQNGIYIVHSLYLTLINNGIANINKQLWRVKIPLKIKIFMWYMKKAVVLMKDNLARRNWGDSKQCSFCLQNETIQHLFFYCYYARFIWRLTHITFGITPPRNIQHMFRPLTNQVGGKLKWHLLAGASAFYWVIWLSRNDVVFGKAPIKYFLHVLYRRTH
jgi:hypothetical protein